MNNKVEISYPLSPMQQGMLVHSLHGGDGGTYIQQLICVMRESVDLALLVSAWRRVVQRHAVLRTSFRWEGQGPSLQGPMQEVNREPELPFISDDWSSLAAEIQQQRMDHFLSSDRHSGFDLAIAPLMRVALFKLGDLDYRMVWTFHHALLDGRSHFLVLRELFDAYDAWCEGRPFELEKPRPYSEYIEWLGEQDLAQAEVFWRDALSGFTTATRLRTATPRTADARAEQQYATVEIRLAAELTAELRVRAQHSGVTLNNLVQASWALLLSRYSGEEDVLFGATRACRHWTMDRAESTVGLLINTLPFRVSVRGEQQLTAWLRELRAQHIALRDYEHTPLMKIKEWSEVPRGTSLFDSVVVFEDYQMNNRLRGLGGNWTRRDFTLLEQTDYPLTLAAYADSDLLLKLEYDQQQFDHATTRRMLEQLEMLLEGMAENPDRRVRELSLLTGMERQLLIDWNQTTSFPTDKSIPELFEQQVKQTPDAVALVFENERLTYRELNERANQLAHYLRRRGVGPDVLVALCFERSLEMIVSVLGTLKAGGAYVPMDPGYPADRLSFMLADAGAKVLLTQKCLQEKLPVHNHEVVAVDSDWETIAKESTENPKTTCAPENLAYVIYTSGSTGKPKGVSIIHRAVTRLVLDTNYVEVKPSDRIAQASNTAFDAATFEIWGALLNGACIIGISRDIALSPQRFANELRERHISVVFLTTALFNQIARDVPSAFSSLRQLMWGGEAVDPHWVRVVLDHGAPQRLLHVYGPTETTTFASWQLVTEVADGVTTIPIGRPISNTRIRVLDRHLNLVPIGVQGELYIGGSGLARGYLNRPELTSEKFVPDPFSSAPAARLYKTGDIGRYLLDGSIEFVGRVDQQIKIRGFRVELGEIESVLAQHEDISECVVIARDDDPGDRQLTAYIILGPGRALHLESVRQFLRQRLPSHMVPAFFMSLEKFPLTPNGKIDRRALPLPKKSRSDLGKPFVAPRSETEKRVAAMWGDVLRREEIGIYDNFFDLGGNSLLATQVMSRVRDVFHQEFPVRSLFEYPRLEEFGRLIDNSGPAENNVHSPAIVPLTRDENVFEVRADSNSRRANSTGRK